MEGMPVCDSTRPDNGADSGITPTVGGLDVEAFMAEALPGCPCGYCTGERMPADEIAATLIGRDRPGAGKEGN